MEGSSRPRHTESDGNAAGRAARARDAGLRKISRLTRRLALGAAGLSGALALIAANGFHGHVVKRGSSSSAPSGTAAQAGNSGASSSASSTASQQPAADPGSSGASSPATPTPPQQVPVQTPAQPAVVSGGS